MAYIVTARKWRPMIFEDVVGQSHITTTLRNAIATNRLPHSFIFSGQRGVGKTTTARILAKAINCLNPKEINPDNKCELCVEITENRSVNVFEIDGASNRGIDEIRNLRDAVRYGPAKGKYKVYIIDEVHMLTKEAFNALLKTLEEPPSYVIFIFATTEVHKVPPTILSRCQRFEFRRISLNEIVSRLSLIAKEEKINIDEEALFIIAKRADGAMRDAQSIFDQVVSFCGETIDAKQIVEMLNLVDEELFFRTIDIIKSKNTKDGLNLIEEIVNRGYDVKEFLRGLIEHLRNMLIVSTTGSAKLIETSEVFKKRYIENSNAFSENDLLRLIIIANDTDSSLRWTQQPRLRLEIGLTRMIKLDSYIEIQSLLSQLEELKKKIGKNDTTISNPTKESTDTTKIETRIRGSVKASQPVLQPSQIVSHARLTAEPPSFYQSSSTALLASLQPSAHKEMQGTTISADEAINKWSVLINEAQRERIALAAMLSETTFIDLKDDHIRIECPDDFHLEALKRNREYITDLAQRVYGAKVRLETIKSEGITQASKPDTSLSLDKVNNTSRQFTSFNHPVIQALIKEFGAEQVD